MATAPASPRQRGRTARVWRVRAGIGKTFGPLFVMLSVLLMALGTTQLYEACAYPLTADSGQVLWGSVSLVIALLLFAFLWRERR